MERILIEGNRANTDSESCAARREEILDEATRLFARLGYADTDTQALVDNLGVGKGTLYRYFPSKRELFLAAVDRVMRRMCAGSTSRFGSGRSSGADVAGDPRLSFLFRRATRLRRTAHSRTHLFKDRKKPTYFEHRETNKTYWHELYQKCIVEGRMRDVPVERISDAISNLVYGKMLTNYFIGQSKPFEEQASDMLDIIFNGILSDAERARRSNQPSASSRD